MNVSQITQRRHEKKVLENLAAAQASTTEAINEDCFDENDGGDSGDSGDSDVEMSEADDEVSCFLLKL